MALNSGGWWIFRIFASSSLISSSISGNFSVTRWGFPPSPLCFGSTGARSMGKARFTLGGYSLRRARPARWPFSPPKFGACSSSQAR